MALIEYTLDGKVDKVKKAIERIRTYNPLELGFDKPYYVCYSGGKDSDAMRILHELSGTPYELVHNHTTMDAPETVYYIRSMPNIHISYPEASIHQLIVKKHMPPTRIQRYCCAELKERGGRDRFITTGVRWSESVKRKKNRASLEIQASKIENSLMLNSDNDESRRIMENCTKKGQRVLNPIIDWSDNDVWEFLNYYGCESNPLYQCGYKRIGCVGCPMSYNRKIEFERYPKFKENYIKTFDRMLAAYPEGKARTWVNGEDVFDWWVNDKRRKNEDIEGQINMWEEFEE